MCHLFSSLNPHMDDKALRSFKNLCKKLLLIKFPQTSVKLKNGRIIFQNVALASGDENFSESSKHSPGKHSV